MKNYFGPRLAKRTCERTCGREQRAFAGRSCGPLRPFQDRNSKLVAVSKGKPAAAVCYRVCGVELGPSGPAARSRPLAEGCNSRPAGPLVQARPLGCELALRLKSTSKRSAGRSLRPAEARSSYPNMACPPQAAPRKRCSLRRVWCRARSLSDRQPAAAPGRRAASSRCSKAGPSARLRAGFGVSSRQRKTPNPAPRSSVPQS